MYLVSSVIGLLFLDIFAMHGMAAEVIEKKDTAESVSEEADIVRTADNFIILFDSSNAINHKSPP